MNDYQKINAKDLLFVCLSICITLFPAFGTSYLIKLSKNATIISTIIGTIIGLIPLYMILFISKYNNSKTIFSTNKENFKIIGNIINIIYVLCIFYMGFIISWSIINFTITQLLLRTSYYFVTIILFCIIGFAVTKGYEIISRSSTILGIMGVIIFAFIIIFLSSKIEIENIYPIFNASKINFIKSVLIIPTITIAPLISILTIKSNNIKDKNNYKKYIFAGYLLAILIICIIIFLLISIYGTNLASLFYYPEYYLYKKISAFEFISRAENIVSITIYICFFANMCMLISFVKTYFQETLNIKKEKYRNILVYILALTIPLLSIYIFKTYQTFYLIDYYPIIGWILLITLSINFILFIIKRKSIIKN